MGKNISHDVIVNVGMSQKLADRLDAVAAAQGVSREAVLRAFVASLAPKSGLPDLGFEGEEDE